jgi:hypothetical protein
MERNTATPGQFVKYRRCDAHSKLQKRQPPRIPERIKL